MRTATVTIGRNVGDNPLPAESWNLFIEETRRAMERVTDIIWTVSPYRGIWNGSPEEAVIFYGPLSENADVPGLRARLSTLATYYGQEAIGLSVGESELVESYKDAPTRQSVLSYT